MKKIHLIMPMAGAGTRFGNMGFNLPKPLIELNSKPFFFWAVQSVKKFVDVKDIVFVVLAEHIEKFNIDKKILSFYPNAIIHKLDHVLNGAVLTCQEGVKKIDDNLPILLNDCDHAFICNDLYNFCKISDFSSPDGALLTFKSDKAIYSYAKFDKKENLIKTVEKEVISNDAICGAYYFKNKEIFLKGVREYLNNCSYSEFFMSGVYNVLAARCCIKSFKLDEHISFGTPEEYIELNKSKEKLEKLL